MYAVILLSLLMSSSLALSILATNANKTTRFLTDSIPAFYAAESCLEQSLRQYVVLGGSTDLSAAGFSDQDIANFQNGATCKRQFQYTPDRTNPAKTASMTISARGSYKQASEGLSVTVTRP
ncbi:hypothetical protein HZA86_04855 [Candidatus Uhrbacteria bacterium]|nr:hypothetical protein [Candidatus Uhrbacteria bacterium]